MMLREDEAKWLAEAEAAMPEPWHNRQVTGTCATRIYGGAPAARKGCRLVCEMPYKGPITPEQQGERTNTIKFITSSRTAVPALCQRISELAEALRERMEKCQTNCEISDERSSNPRYCSELPLEKRCDLCRKAAKLLEGRGA